MHWRDRIGFDSGVLGGKPVVKGTRLAVEKIVELMAAGWTEQQILENHPGISHDDIAACLFYASEVLKSERVVTLAASHRKRVGMLFLADDRVRSRPLGGVS